jgi:hypothetical protein
MVASSRHRIDRFSEFLRADFFRQRISPEHIKREPSKATRIAVRMSTSTDVHCLPGASGVAPT